MTSALLLGALIGLRHATDADHLAAVSTLVARDPSRSRASALGAAWSLGHGTTLLGVGGVFLLLSLQVPPSVAIGAEAVVALLLIGLGISNLNHAGRTTPHEPLPRTGRRALVQSGLVGLAHGAAGSGLVAVAAAAAMPTQREALLYLVAFGLGTAGGMILFSTLLASPLRWITRKPHRHQWIHRATGGASLVVGCWLALQASQAWIAA